MKIKFEHEEFGRVTNCSLEDPEATTIDIVRAFANFLQGATYHKSSIINAFEHYIEENTND